MDNLKVSVIVPVYNAEKFITQCAMSLFEQTYKNVQYIFIDDACQDKSISILNEVLQRYPECKERTIIIRNEKNVGCAASRNIGLSVAKGDFIIWCDSDDWFECNAFQLFIETEKKTNADLIYCDYRVISGSDKSQIMKPVNINGLDKISFLKLYIISPMTSLSNIFAKKELYIGLQFNDGFDMWEDFGVTPKLYYQAEKIVYLDSCLYNYRCNNIDSLCRSNDSVIKAHSRMVNVLAVYTYFKDKTSIYKDIYKSLFYKILFAKQYYFYKEKDFKTYMTIVPEAFDYLWSNPLSGWKAKFVEFLAVKLYSIIMYLSNVKVLK